MTNDDPDSGKVYGFVSDQEEISIEPVVVDPPHFDPVNPRRAVVAIDDPAIESVYHWKPDVARSRADAVEEHSAGEAAERAAERIRGVADAAESAQELLDEGGDPYSVPGVKEDKGRS